MPVKVLVVDDSSFYRNRITELLAADNRIEVVGYATDGLDAIRLVKQHRPDVVTMDVEMPNMNGIEALKSIMRESPTHVIMLSAHTSEGAVDTIRALEAGAADYFLKNSRTWADPKGQLKHKLVERIVALSRSRVNCFTSSLSSSSPRSSGEERQFSSSSSTYSERYNAHRSSGAQRDIDPYLSPLENARQNLEAESRSRSTTSSRGYEIVAIGSSTGGTQAVQNLLSQLPNEIPPIVIIQHIPEVFSKALAE